jgi:hypothetical protein
VGGIMTKTQALRVVGGAPRYMRDSEILERFAISAMTLNRWRKDPRVNFPKPIAVIAGGPHLTPTIEVEGWETALLQTPRTESEEKRKGGRRLAAFRGRKLAGKQQRVGVETPGRDPEGPEQLNLGGPEELL